MQSLVEVLEMVQDARESIECGKANNAACLVEMIEGDLVALVWGQAQVDQHHAPDSPKPIHGLATVNLRSRLAGTRRSSSWQSFNDEIRCGEWSVKGGAA